jgi:hypothetical protein
MKEDGIGGICSMHGENAYKIFIQKSQRKDATSEIVKYRKRILDTSVLTVLIWLEDIV